MPNPATISPPANTKMAAKVPTRWGQKGISERFYVEDVQLSETPNNQQVILADAGLVSELQHHHFGTYTISGNPTKDQFGPYTFLNNYMFKVGAGTPLVNVSGRMMGILQIIEYPDRTFETSSVAASDENALALASDIFNYPSVTGTMRVWFRVPLALKLVGAPGGYVGYIVLQNKRISNVVLPTFALTGASSPYSATQASGSGNAAYLGGTVTAAPTFETWKTLNTVPQNPNNMPLFGFIRYITEALQPYSGTSFTYDFEPGGELLRAVFQFLDNTAGPGSIPAGMATANLNQIAYQYGTNKQMDVYTPYRNIHQQILDYGRPLPQGCFAFDYYTPSRSLVNTKSTENTANVQVVAQFASGYSVPANSQVSVLLDKVLAVQNYLGK